MSKIKLGIFCPSSFNDYPFLRDLLNKKRDDIGLIISNGAGYALPERYAKEINCPVLTYPIGKNLNCLKANDLILRASDHILIIDNGQSQNNEVVIKKCQVAEKSFKVIDAPKEGVNNDILVELKGIWEEYVNEDMGEDKNSFIDFLVKHKKVANKLEKELGKIK